MIRVTRLDGQEIALNCDLIESIESRPDTTIRLTTGQSLVVRESLDETVERVADWRARVLARAGPGSRGTPAPTTDELAEDMVELFGELADLEREERLP